MVKQIVNYGNHLFANLHVPLQNKITNHIELNYYVKLSNHAYICRLKNEQIYLLFDNVLPCLCLSHLFFTLFFV